MGLATVESMRKLGGFLVLIGIIMLGFIFWPVAKLEVDYQRGQPPETEIVPLDTELGIVIPKIGANSRIVKEVGPFNSQEYQLALTKGVAHAAGTPLPGDGGNSFLFSHSSVDFFRATQYNSVFYLLSKLEPGDPIYIYRDGQKITFQVTEKRIVSDNMVDLLKSKDAKPRLTLMTCWPPGTSLQRMVVTAMLGE